MSVKNRYVNALISSSLSIVPIILLVLILSFIPYFNINLGTTGYILLIVGMVILILGLALFQIGASSSLTKVGEYMGSSLSKQKSLFVVILFAFVLGALITCAEPSIMIVTKQVNIDGFLLIGCIAGGVGLFIVIGVLRIIFNRNLKLWYLLFYAITFMLLIFIAMDENKRVFLPFIFDSGGITTGSATVPFILSLGAGVAAVRGGRKANDNSFGLVGVASIGPILTMTILIMLSSFSGDYVPSYNSINADANVVNFFIDALLPTDFTNLGTLINVFVALAPIMIIFFIYNFLFIKLPRKKIYKLLIGFGFTYLGLVLFLTAASAAMTPIGYMTGQSISNIHDGILILLSFIMGMVTILCEPAVHVLTTQMEEVSDGRIGKMTVILSLSIGVGVAIALATIRTIYNFSILYYIVPGYIISLVLMFVCPDIYTAMAFDSGGTASGPMSSSFILPLVIGITNGRGELSGIAPNYYEQGFGVIALIALTPIIAIQLLGVSQKIKDVRAARIMHKHKYSLEDAQIIHFKED